MIKINDFTLSVMVRDRHYNIPNVLEYYKNLDCEKIIFDSSIKKYNDIRSIEKAGFKYVYFPQPIDMFQKFNKIFNEYVKTTYVLDCPDDDVALISSLETCVDF